MERQSLSAALVRVVQVKPSGEVITRLPVPEPATATNKLIPGAQTTLRQELSAGVFWSVHVIPSDDVITRLPATPEYETTTNRDLSGDHVMAFTVEVVSGVVRAVQITPSGEVINDDGPPDIATAANKPNWGDQQTARQSRVATGVLGLQKGAGAGCHETACRVEPAEATATKVLTSGA